MEELSSEFTDSYNRFCDFRFGRQCIQSLFSIQSQRNVFPLAFHFFHLPYLFARSLVCLPFPPISSTLSLSLSLCVFIFLSFFGSIVFILAIALLNYLLVKVRFLLPSPPFSCLSNIWFFALFLLSKFMSLPIFINLLSDCYAILTF